MEGNKTVTLKVFATQGPEAGGIGTPAPVAFVGVNVVGYTDGGTKSTVISQLESDMNGNVTILSAANNCAN